MRKLILAGQNLAAKILSRSGGIKTLVEMPSAVSAPAHASVEAVAAAELLTAEGGPVKISDHQRQFCAALADGTFFVSKSHLADGEIMSVADTVRRTVNVTCGQPTPVDMSFLRQLYGGEASRHLGASAMRERFVSIIDMAALSRVPDIHCLIFDGHGTVKFQISTYLTDAVIQLTEDEMTAFFTTAFYYADNGDTVLQRGITQRCTVTDRKKLPDGVMSLRYQFAEVAGGWLMNIRFIYAKLPIIGSGLDPLDLPRATVTTLKTLFYASSGVITVVGPTDSGKSTCLDLWFQAYSDAFNNRVVVASASDPPESVDERVYSFPVNSDEGETADPFARAGFTALRVNPHAFKMGEVRSAHSALETFRIANTAVLVATTMHTQDALDVPSRYKALGVPDEVVFDAKRNLLFMGVRLVPTLCPLCRVPVKSAAAQHDTIAALLESFESNLPEVFDGATVFVKGPGCEHCQPKGLVTIPGLLGRRFLAELVRPTPELMAELRREPAQARRTWIVAGANSLALQGLPQLLDGTFGLEEFAKKIATAEQLRADFHYAQERPGQEVHAE